MNTWTPPPRLPLLGLFLALIVPGLFYLATLQTIPNGSSQYYMIDVGETQIVLNVWGTLHATGYPHYVLTGSAFTALLRGLGVDAAAAPALVSLGWGLLALALLYGLLAHLTARPLIAAGVTLAFGLTRTVWIHAAIAEIYAFGLVILIALLALALWRRDAPGLTSAPARLYWLALLGGIGVAHHRAFVMAIPALVGAAWPYFRACGRALPKVIVVCLALGLLGFLPYVYLPLREAAAPAWTYGDPSTLAGFLDQFLGREANRFIGLPGSWTGLRANFDVIMTVLVTDLTWPGLAAGIAGLAWGLLRRETRRAAGVLLVSAGAAYAFHVAYYTDVLSALILPVTLSLAAGWALLADGLLLRLPARGAGGLLAAGGLLLTVTFARQNLPFIRQHTTDPTGQQTAALVAAAPPESAVMLAWGPRYFAAAFEQRVRGGLEHLTLVDDKADFAALAAQPVRLLTPEYTFYHQPVAWWQERLGREVYLRAAAPQLVEIGLAPERTAEVVAGVAVVSAEVVCAPEQLLLQVTWAAGDAPQRDLSVFVHLLDDSGQRLAQGDQAAPVYGWRPLTTWQAGEAVRDVYPLPRLPNAAVVRFGLYYQASDGTFVNDYTFEQRVDCP